MLIYLVNFSYGNNYGALLQAYALQEAVKKINDGFDVCTVGHISKKTSLLTKCRRYVLLLLTSSWYRKKFILKLIDMKSFCNNQKILFPFEKNIQYIFEKTRKHLITFTENQCYTLADYRNLPKPDIIICGSDVIWAVEDFSENIEIYFLHWASPATYRIAYAPSWGRSNINNLNYFTKKKISYYLAKFDAVSVREKSGVDICASLGRTDAQWVPDPTMLLTAEDWDKIAESRFNKPYILNYRIPYNKSVEDTKILSVIEECYRVPIKKVPDIDSEYVWLSPTEWLGGIRDAEFVVTNSFHGVVFCIIYNINFLFTKLVGEHEMLNERIYSLLELFDLLDRIITEDIVSDAGSIKSLVESPIDWNKVNKKLVSWRQVGIDFLDEALKKANKNKSANIRNSYVDR